MADSKEGADEGRPGAGTRPPTDRPAPRRSKKGLKLSLTALGTAAVLTIYAAGYALTEDAARRLDEGLGAAPPTPPEPSVGEGERPVEAGSAQPADSGPSKTVASAEPAAPRQDDAMASPAASAAAP